MPTPSTRIAVVCGVDVGTTNSKVAALDGAGRVVGRATRATPRNPSDLSIDAHALFDTVEDMLVEVCSDAYRIQAVATAGIGEDGVLVDSSFEALDHALAWFDPRRARLFRDIEPELTPVPSLGVTTDSSRTLVGWLWAAQHRDCQNAVAWVALTDYAATRWSGGAFMSDTIAARTSAWVPESRQWIEERVMATLGDEALLPPVVPAGAVVGPLVSTRLAGAGVVADDAVVVAGGHDHPIGGWAVDRLHPGAILDSMGTAEVVVAQSAELLGGRRDSIDVAPGIRSPGSTLLRVEELARNVGWAGQDPAVAAAIRAITSGQAVPDDNLFSEFFRPGSSGGGRPRYVKGAPKAPAARAAAVVGALARLGGGAVDAVAAHMPARAPVFAAGGWARSPGWMEAKRLVTGRDITVVEEPEVTVIGAALLAAAALDWHASASVALSTDRAAV